MPILSKAISGAIGLGSEFKAQNAQRKASRSPSPNPTPETSNLRTEGDSSEETSDDDDEYDWALDDALAPPGYSPPEYLTEQESQSSDAQSKSPKVAKIVQNFVQRHPAPVNPTTLGKLPLPVVLPQRRPEHKDRGFVRAYAPDLQACGVDQKTWFEFLDGFHQAIKMHPAFHALNLAVLGAAITIDVVAGPSIIAHLVAMTLHIGVEASRRTFIIYETNKYLDSMNEQFFKPRGLYAMIMMYKPDSKDAITDFDPATRFTGAIASRSGGEGGKFKQSSGKARNELEAIEVAPLIYPQLDGLSEAEKNNKMQSAGQFLRDYYDRRGQALFDYNNPGSNLATPRQDFASKYSDPTHPVNSGGLIALATGGRRQGIRTRRKGFKPGQARGPKRITKKILKQDVLYLMVVNMPSEAELEAAKAVIQSKV